MQEKGEGQGKEAKEGLSVNKREMEVGVCKATVQIKREGAGGWTCGRWDRPHG